MSTHLTPEQTKEFVRKHFEDFVNKRNVGVIRKNMTADFYDHDGPGGKPTTGIDGQFSVIGPKGFFVGVFVPSFVVIYCVAANPDGVTQEVVCFQFPKLL